MGIARAFEATGLRLAAKDTNHVQKYVYRSEVERRFCRIGPASGGAGVVLHHQLSHLYADTATISGNLLPSTRYASQMHVAILDARRSELAQVIGGLNKDAQEVSERTVTFNKAKQEFDAAAQKYGSLPFSTDEEKQTYEALLAAGAKYFSVHEQLIAAFASGDLEK